MAERYRRTTDACGEDDVRIGRETASEGEEAASFSVGVSMNNERIRVLRVARRVESRTIPANVTRDRRPFHCSSHATTTRMKANGNLRELLSAVSRRARSSRTALVTAGRCVASDVVTRSAARASRFAVSDAGEKKTKRQPASSHHPSPLFVGLLPAALAIFFNAFERHAEALRAPPPTARRPRRRLPRRPPAAAPRARRAPPRRVASRSPAPP